MARPAVSKHLRVLRDAGLVTARQEAQQRFYRLQPEPLVEIDEWISKMYFTAPSFWDGRL